MFFDKEKEAIALSFDEILIEEKIYLKKIKGEAYQKVDKQKNTDGDHKLIGLAFSGGGIRSATINLGVLQVLSKHGLLNCFDYLSTVSGGGYIGAYISSLIHHKKGDTKNVEMALKNTLEDEKTDKRTKVYDTTNEIQEDINWFRSYSNYLTPKKGLFTTDTLAAFSQWLCNSIVNQLLLASCLIIIFMSVNGANDFSSYFFCEYTNLCKPLDKSSELTPLMFSLGFGIPICITVMTFIAMILMGFGGRDIPLSIREWCYRVGGIGIAFMLVWLTVFICAIWIPQLISTCKIGNKGVAGYSIFSYLFALATAKLGQNRVSSATDSSAIINKLSKFLPYIVIALIFIGLGYLSYKIYHGDYTLYWTLSLLFIVLIGSWRFDINIFSLHNFYRNRLTRCYLGATNPDRKSNIFTGFAEGDDLRFADLKDQRPIHIINTALNISDGSELAWQQRKAASFSFTPYHCGFELLGKKPEENGGFRKTEEYADTKGGPLLGSLMAVSGAAASPNSGYHTNPVMGFIMTIFNARLGRWFGNPSNKSSTWQKISPTFSLPYLVKELFTKTHAKSDYLYLSDGGHFENLGIYELIRRKCKLIIAIDAGEDGGYQFDDLGNAIRKCQTDLDVRLKFDDLKNLHPSKQSIYGSFKHSEKHYAIGEILYDEKNAAKNGILLYIKSSLTGTEPADLINFKLQEPAFPHHYTVDQFFDESQFESYRRLGEHIAKEVMLDINKSKNSKATQNLARDILNLINSAKR